MIKKTIQINPELFKLSGGKKSKKKKKLRTKLLSSSIKPNKLKKQLIARVKEHQKKKQQELDNEISNKKLETFQSDFNDSMNYLDTITKKNKNDKKRKKREKFEKKNNHIQNYKNKEFEEQFNIKPTHTNKITLSDTNITNNENTINANIINEIKNLIKPEPPYGILKHGKKQLYSNYRKTLKKNTTSIKPYSEPIIIQDKETPTNDFSLRRNKLEILKNKIRKDEENIKRKPKYKRRKTKRLIKKVTLGKNKNNNTIGVLIKNRKTRKKIDSELKKIQKSKLSNIKSYLRKHNLIKIGSDAPEHILRNIYENSYLSGEVINNSSEIMLHNYMTDGIKI
jgi:hypothetical protein